MLGRVVRTILVFALMGACCGVAFAQATADANRWEPGRLRRAIEDRYRVAPLRDGVVLVPRRDAREVQSIEVTGSTVAINGAVVTGAELQERLASDSDAILALSYLDPDARKALFDLRPAPEPGQRAAEPTVPPAAQPAPGTAPSEEREGRRRVTRNTDARIHIGGGVTVGEQEVVDGPVVAVGGSARVDGEVRGDVVAVAGDVRLGPNARVRGDVTTVGGAIDRDARAEVDGTTHQVSLAFPHFRVRPGFHPVFGLLGGALGPGAAFMATSFRMLLFGLLVVLVFLIARTPVERIERVIAIDAWKAGLVGVLTELFFIPIFVLTVVVLAVSIIGIPLLLFVPPLAVVAFAIALIIGFAGVAYRVGDWLAPRFGMSRQAAIALVLAGLIAVWLPTIAGRTTSMIGGSFWGVSSALLVAGFVVEWLAWTVGLGAAVMTRLGTRPAEPPAPPAPPIAAPPVGGPA